MAECKKKLPPDLETERLVLRPLSMDDKTEIFKWTSDPRVARFMLYSTYKSPDEADDWLKSLYLTDKNIDYGFVWKKTGELIGSGGLYFQDDTKSWKIGYNLRFDMWGKGIATEACRKMIEYAKNEFNAKKITGIFAIDNPNSGRVMEKLGMQFIGKCEYKKFDGSETFKAFEYGMSLS